MRNKGYFKGWYFKCCSADKTVAFIPAYHCANHVQTASLQIITDNAVYNMPIEALRYSEKPLRISFGNCEFSEKGITLNVRDREPNLEGTLHFQSLSPIRYDIMGPFALVPFMQCRHSVYSMEHRINGQIMVDDQLFVFKDEVGYIEGDRGYSFPEQYIWTQCCFENGSLMLSVADIPFCGLHFTGIIGVVLLDGKEYRIATYLGASVEWIGENAVIVKQGQYELEAKLLKRNAQPLLAPANGSMSRTIHESASCKAYYRFSHNGKTRCEFISNRAGFEFEYNLV